MHYNFTVYFDLKNIVQCCDLIGIVLYESCTIKIIINYDSDIQNANLTTHYLLVALESISI